jgi:hypothetical protein
VRHALGARRECLDREQLDQLLDGAVGPDTAVQTALHVEREQQDRIGEGVRLGLLPTLVEQLQQGRAQRLRPVFGVGSEARRSFRQERIRRAGQPANRLRAQYLGLRLELALLGHVASPARHIRRKFGASQAEWSARCRIDPAEPVS